MTSAEEAPTSHSRGRAGSGPERAHIAGIVLARGGSKRISGKNLRLLAGRPLLTHTVAAALESGALETLVVSTDDPKIAAAARKAGAAVPFMRPAELATDHATSHDALAHAVDRLEAEGTKFDALMLLQPTSPLRTAADIAAVARRLNEGAQAVVSVAPVSQHPMWMKTIDVKAGFLRPFLDEPPPALGQDQPPLYILNGAIYAASLGYWREQGGFYGPATMAYVMPRERSVDLDEPVDWLIAERLLAEKRDA